MAGVKAGAAVQARFVIRAIVEILVAEQPAPALIARALPRLLTSTVETARVPHALIALQTLPAVVASATNATGCDVLASVRNQRNKSDMCVCVCVCFKYSSGFRFKKID